MKRGGKIAIGLGLLALLVIAGSILADRKLKSLGHPGLQKFAHQVMVNYPKGFATEPMVLEIRVNENDLAHIEKVVEDARARGVIIPEGNEYVTADVTGPDGTFKAKVRIKGKLTDHVKGSKWSFRVVAKKDGGFLGMHRFSLQHPGTRNYLYDWFFHRVMEGEGVIALRYGFIRLRFNDEDLGVYAYEEHFGPELLENNERLAGPIFRFDPGLYWEHRLNEMQKLKLDEPYADYQAASVDAFGSKAVAKDERSLREFEEAVGLIDGFRRGKLSASQVFDADKIARRHAILDLIGGHHSMDFSDVKFYYDPVAQRVEPVSYESFSAFKIRTLAGSNKYIGTVHEGQDLHEAYFNDPVLFRSYIHHLERISRTSYLDSVFTALGPALDSASAVVYQEFPWKELDRSIFENNQKVIRRLLDVPKGFHAHLQGRSGDTLEILAIPIEALPLEVHHLSVDGGDPITPVAPVIIPIRTPGRMGVPVPLKFVVPPVAEGVEQKFTINYSVLGASVKQDLEVFPYALNEQIVERTIKAGQAPNMRTFPFVHVDEEQKVIHFRTGSWSIASDLVIPAGYVVRADAPFDLDLTKGARIVSRSPITLKGVPGRPVQLFSSDRQGSGLLVIDAGAASHWDHVEMDNLGPSDNGNSSLAFQGSPVVMRNCRLGGDPSRDLLQLVRSSAHIVGCTFAGGRDQLNSTYSHVRIQDLTAYGAQDDALVFRGGMVDLRDVRIENTHDTGLKGMARAEITASDLSFFNVGKGIQLGEGTDMFMEKSSILSKGVGIGVADKAMRYGPVTARFENIRIEAGEAGTRIGKGNDVRVNGSTANQEAQAGR